MYTPHPWRGNITWHLDMPSPTEGVSILIYLFTFYLADLYDLKVRFRDAGYLLRLLTATILVPVIMTGLIFIFPAIKSGQGGFILNSTIVVILLFIWRFVFDWWFRGVLRQKKNVLIVGAGRAGKVLYNTIKNNANYNMLGFIIDDDPAKWDKHNSPVVVGGSSMLKEMVETHRVDIVVIAITHLKGPELLKCALDCKLMGVDVYDMPSFYEHVTGKVPVEHVTNHWLISVPLSGVRRNIYTLRVKRVLDLVLSVFLILLTLPLTLLAALPIKIDSRGPIFFRQKRVGINGRPFYLLKFRTMRTGMEKDREFAGRKDDPRITRVGKLLRALRIDEIPQALNVLKGDMSFIGPRALIEAEVNEFEPKIPYFSLRHSIRPGITGWAQVHYKHGVTTVDALEKLQYDLFYIKNLSPILDFIILLKTIKVVLWGKGAR
jgi:exopolysaccharide biosynthesis polyprenyl glycosylphosphotransferase